MSKSNYTLERTDRSKPFSLCRDGKAIAQMTGDMGELASIIAALNGHGEAEQANAIRVAGASVAAAIAARAEQASPADDEVGVAQELIGL